MAEYTPGYVDVPGKGRRYRTANGEYFDNHFGAIGNSFANVFRGAGAAYNNYYNNVADSVGTERRDGSTAKPKPKAKGQKTAAPPQAAVSSNGSNGSRGENRSGVTPVNGSFRTAVEQGPDGGATPSSGNAGSGNGGSLAKPGARVNANGLVSYGKDLSSLNAFTSAFTGGYELTDIKSAFQSNDLEGAYQNGSNTISTDESKYTLPDGSTPSNVGGKYTMDGVDTSIQSTGYQISDKSVPGTIGGNANDPQDGTSSKPDVAESIRQVRMQRKGPRDEGGPRGFRIDRENEMAQNSASETTGNGMNEKRRAIRSAFLDMDTPIIQASVKANAIAGYGKDSDGNARFNYGGELVYAKDGMQQKAKNAAMMGEDPSQYLDIPTAGDIQPDTPAASELSTNLLSGVEPGSITAPENNGGSLETTAPLTTPSPEKFKQAQDFMSGKMNMLNRRTK